VPAYGARGLAAAVLLGYVLHTCWTQTYLMISLRKSRVAAAEPSPVTLATQ